MQLRIGILILLLAAGQSLLAQGIEFIHDDLAEAKEKAANEGKLIFVDAYTTWCGPCKRLSKNVFPQEEAGTFFNQEFINLKLNMEKGDGPSFGRKHKVSAYPTLLFIDADGNEVHRAVGALKLPDLMEFARAASGRQDKSAEWAILYDNGDRSYETIFNYVTALNDADKSSSKITNAYLRSQSDLSTEDNLRFIHTATYESDSRAFELLIENKKKIVKLVGADAVNEQIKNALDRTAAKAATYEMIFLLDEAHAHGEKHTPKHVEEFYPKWINQYFTKVPDPNAYAGRIDKTWSADRLLEAGKIATRVYYNQAGLQEKIATLLKGKEKQLRDQEDYYLTLATLYRLLGEQEKKTTLLTEGIARLKQEELSTKKLEKYLKKAQE